MQRDPGIEILLDLHGLIVDQGDGFWIKIEAWRVEPSPDVPHGIRYSLSLHDSYGRRVLAYDNAHAVKNPKKFRYAGQIRTRDHTHQHVADKGVPYEFRDASQLLVDFFMDADRMRAQKGK